MLKLEVFTHTSLLELKIGYYHIGLSPGSKYLCTIILPWGKYEFQKLPMGIYNSLYIFQEETSKLFERFDTVRAYIDDVLVIINKDFTNYLKELEKVSQKLVKECLKLNIEKSFSGKTETG